MKSDKVDDAKVTADKPEQIDGQRRDRINDKGFLANSDILVEKIKNGEIKVDWKFTRSE